MCSCLPKVLELFGNNLFDSVSDGADISAATINVVGDVIQLQKVYLFRNLAIGIGRPRLA